MYVVRTKKTKEVLFINHAPLKDKLKGKDVWPEYDHRTMQIIKSKLPDLPAHYRVDENDMIVALTNDVMEERERHYVTVWMLGVPTGEAIDIRDTSEIKEAGWYSLTELPAPLHPYFENLLAGRCLPPQQPEAWLRSV